MSDEKYISQKEALLAFVEKGQSSKRYKLGEIWELNFEEIREALDKVPAADVRPVVRGNWERPKGYTTRSWIFVCSKCGDRAYFPVPKYFPKGCGYKFCPNCGAAMREEVSDNV